MLIPTGIYGALGVNDTVLMPLRASCSFQPLIVSSAVFMAVIVMVLMPLRASCSFQLLAEKVLSYAKCVLMPLRASCSFQRNYSGKHRRGGAIVLMPLRASCSFQLSSEFGVGRCRILAS